MTKENFITPIIIAGLFVAFVAVSIIAWSSGGNGRLINSKIKLGAAILTLTAFVSTNSFSQVKCYEVAVDETISFYKLNSDNAIELNTNNNTLTGKLENIIYADYLFAITDSNSNVVRSGELIAKDGTFDENKEDFTITFDNLKAGEYQLNIYSSEENRNKLRAKYTNKLIINAINSRQHPDVYCYF